jgi:hypothetical protein
MLISAFNKFTKNEDQFYILQEWMGTLKTNCSAAIKRQPRYPLYDVPLLSGLDCRAVL